jgi:hypothetical protein
MGAASGSAASTSPRGQSVDRIVDGIATLLHAGHQQQLVRACV